MCLLNHSRKKKLYTDEFVSFYVALQASMSFFIKDMEGINLTYQENFIFHDICVNCLDELMNMV